jgi:hypothetical protein
MGSLPSLFRSHGHFLLIVAAIAIFDVFLAMLISAIVMGFHLL